MSTERPGRPRRPTKAIFEEAPKTERPGRPRRPTKVVVEQAAEAEPPRRPPRTEETPYGRVNRRVLNKLQDSFNTRRLLDAAGMVDEIGRRTGYDEGSIRNELMMLHGMAHALIDGGVNTARDTKTPIWELAEALSVEIFGWIRDLEKVERLLDRLARLAPEDDEEEEDDDE